MGRYAKSPTNRSPGATTSKADVPSRHEIHVSFSWRNSLRGGSSGSHVCGGTKLTRVEPNALML
jgi:hypothetical protein